MLTIAVCLILIFYGYSLVSRKDRSLLNWTTPAIALGIPSLFLLPSIYTIVFSTESSTYAQQYSLVAYTVELVLPALTYRWIKAPALGCKGARTKLHVAHWVFLLLGVMTFMPVLMQFRSHLLDPRYIYMETRRGFGITFFGSALFLNVAGVLYFFRASKRRILDTLFWVVLIAVSLEHGSKGELVQFVWYWVLFRVYIDNRPFRVAEAVRFISIAGITACIAFVFLGVAEPGELIQGFAKYADYPRNAARVIDDPDRPTYLGLIAVENAIYSRIPRAVFPGKPEIYGTYRLTMRYFSAVDWEDVGSPDFNIGIPYADFGPFAIIYIAAFAAFGGWSASCVVRKMRTDPNPGNLLLLAFFAGIQLIPLGVGYLLPETILLAFVVQRISQFPKLRVFPRVRSHPHKVQDLIYSVNKSLFLNKE